MKNAPRKNAGLSSICGYCKTPLDTLEQTKMATPKPEAPGSNPGRDAKSNAESLDLSGFSAFLVSGGLSDQAVKSSDTDFSVSGFNALTQSKFPANKC